MWVRVDIGWYAGRSLLSLSLCRSVSTATAYRECASSCGVGGRFGVGYDVVVVVVVVVVVGVGVVVVVGVGVGVGVAVGVWGLE